MSTQFVSKNSNYMLVLKSGIEGNRALGTHAIPGIYVKFQGGALEVKEAAIVEMLRSHPSYGVDFLEVKENEIDPFLDTRDDSEPGHIIQEINYGHAGKAVGSTIKNKLTPQMKKAIEAEALKMIPGLLKSNPDILKNIILDLSASMKKAEEKVESPKEVKEKVTEKEAK